MKIELININKKNEEKNILQNINLTVKSNNIISIIGPNGAGKTSLLRIIGLIDKQTSGKLLFDKKEIKSQADRLNIQRKIGVVFTKPELLDMNVYENIIYPMKVIYLKDFSIMVYACLQEQVFQIKTKKKLLILFYLSIPDFLKVSIKLNEK